MKYSVVAASILVVLSGTASPAFAAHDIHSKEGHDGKKAFGGYANYSHAVESLGEKRANNLARNELARRFGEGNGRHSEGHSEGLDSLAKEMEAHDAELIKKELSHIDENGGLHDAKSIELATIARQQADQIQFNEEAQTAREAHSAEVTATLAGSRQLNSEQAQIVLKSISQVTSHLYDGSMTVAQYQTRINLQRAANMYPAMVQLEQKILNDYVASKVGRNDQAVPTLNPIPVAERQLQQPVPVANRANQTPVAVPAGITGQETPNAIPQGITGQETPHPVPVANRQYQEPVAVPAANRVNQTPVAVPAGITGQETPKPIPQGLTDQQTPKVVTQTTSQVKPAVTIRYGRVNQHRDHSNNHDHSAQTHYSDAAYHVGPHLAHHGVVCVTGSDCAIKG